MMENDIRECYQWYENELNIQNEILHLKDSLYKLEKNEIEKYNISINEDFNS